MGSNGGPQQGGNVTQPSCELPLPALAASPSVCWGAGLTPLICFRRWRGWLMPLEGRLSWPSRHFQWSPHWHGATELPAVSPAGLLDRKFTAKASCGVVLWYPGGPVTLSPAATPPRNMRRFCRPNHQGCPLPDHTLGVISAQAWAGLLQWLSDKEYVRQCRDVRQSIHGFRRSPGEGNSNLVQYSSLGNPRDRRACRATAIGSQRVEHDERQQKGPDWWEAAC